MAQQRTPESSPKSTVDWDFKPETSGFTAADFFGLLKEMIRNPKMFGLVVTILLAMAAGGDFLMPASAQEGTGGNPDATEVMNEVRAVITTQSVNVRTSPDSSNDGNLVGTLPANVPLLVVDTDNPNWLEIQGFAVGNADYLNLDADLQIAVEGGNIYIYAPAVTDYPEYQPDANATEAANTNGAPPVAAPEAPTETAPPVATEAPESVINEDLGIPSEIQSRAYDTELDAYVEGDVAYYEGFGDVRISDSLITPSFGTISYGIPANWEGDTTDLQGFEFTNNASVELWEAGMTQFWLAAYMREYNCSESEAQQHLENDDPITIHWLTDADRSTAVTDSNSFDFQARPSQGLTIMWMPDMIGPNAVWDNHPNVARGEVANSAFGLAVTEHGRLTIAADWAFNYVFDDVDYRGASTTSRFMAKLDFIIEELVGSEGGVPQPLRLDSTQTDLNEYEAFVLRREPMLRAFGLDSVVDDLETDLAGTTDADSLEEYRTQTPIVSPTTTP